MDEHDYVSTACMHGHHEMCRLQCKYCAEPCRCGCGHLAHDVAAWQQRAELAEADRDAWQQESYSRYKASAWDLIAQQRDQARAQLAEARDVLDAHGPDGRHSAGYDLYADLGAVLYPAGEGDAEPADPAEVSDPPHSAGKDETPENFSRLCKVCRGIGMGCTCGYGPVMGANEHGPAQAHKPHGDAQTLLTDALAAGVSDPAEPPAEVASYPTWDRVAEAWDEGWKACSDWWYANAAGESHRVAVEAVTNPYQPSTPSPEPEPAVTDGINESIAGEPADGRHEYKPMWRTGTGKCVAKVSDTIQRCGQPADHAVHLPVAAQPADTSEGP